MRTRRSFRGAPGITDPNLTPLIDVCLVLVVILLVATPMTLQSGIHVARAASSGKRGAPVRAARIEITIRDDQSLTINRTVIARDQLGAALRPLLAKSPTALRNLKHSFNANGASVTGFLPYDALEAYRATEEAREGTLAFAEKREPDFSRWR